MLTKRIWCFLHEVLNCVLKKVLPFLTASSEFASVGGSRPIKGLSHSTDKQESTEVLHKNKWPLPVLSCACAFSA